MNHTMKTRSIAWLAAAALAVILPGGQRGPGAGPGAASGAGHRRARDERQCRHDGLDDRNRRQPQRRAARGGSDRTPRTGWLSPARRPRKGATLARVDARALELQLKENDAQISRLSANAGSPRHAARAAECAAGRHRVEEPDRRGGRATRDGAPRTRAGTSDSREHAAPHLARDDPRAISGLRGGAHPPARRVRVRVAPKCCA